jgi:hypothetical protein
MAELDEEEIKHQILAKDPQYQAKLKLAEASEQLRNSPEFHRLMEICQTEHPGLRPDYYYEAVLWYMMAPDYCNSKAHIDAANADYDAFMAKRKLRPPEIVDPQQPDAQGPELDVPDKLGEPRGGDAE